MCSLLRSEAGILSTSTQAPPFRFVRGTYDSTGPTIVAGKATDFSLTKNGVGDVSITFLTPFRTVPTFLTNPQRPDTADANVTTIIGDPTVSVVRCFRKTLGGTPQDGIVHFIAISDI